jgi:hypothetical protein
MGSQTSRSKGILNFLWNSKFDKITPRTIELKKFFNFTNNNIIIPINFFFKKPINTYIIYRHEEDKKCVENVCLKY